MDFLSKVILCFSVYWITYYLNHQKKFGAVKASSIIAILIGLIYQTFLYLQLEIDIAKHYFLIAMGSTFMGMISNVHQHKKIDFVLSSFIFVALYTNSSHFFEGLGGLLGTIACISILCVFGIERILLKFNK